MNTNLTINGVPGISFSGIEEVQNVSVSNMPATITGRVEYNFPGLKKIGTLSVSQAYGASLGVLRFPDLTEISGKLTLSEGFGQKVQPTEFPVLRIFNPFYKKNKEILLYLFFGGLTFLVSIISYAFLNIQIGWNALIANIGSWILAVSFAYVTNRVWVFDSNAETTADFIKEITSFIGGRVATLVIEELILFIFITNLGMNSMLVKIVAQVIVIVLNYVISKLIVFKK